jgi:hypothetical protein
MKKEIIDLKFVGRRTISSSRKKSYYVGGIVFLILGLVGFITSNVLSSLYIAFSIGGILNIIYGLIGKELIKEKNYISIYPEEIEFKNSFKKPQNIKINNLLDLRIEKAKVEFVMNDQRITTYDFSIFQEHELNKIHNELDKIKASLIE